MKFRSVSPGSRFGRARKDSRPRLFSVRRWFARGPEPPVRWMNAGRRNYEETPPMLLKLLKALRPRRPERRSPRRKQRSDPRILNLQCEVLEQRIVPAVTANALVNGVWTITMDGAETVAISNNAGKAQVDFGAGAVD